MTITDPPTDDPLDRPPEDATTSSEPVAIPSIRQFRWPIVQALRKLGGQAPTVEIARHVADAFGLTRQQRSETVPSGQVRLVNRVQWASLELKHIGVLHYPEPGIRALSTSAWKSMKSKYVNFTPSMRLRSGNGSAEHCPVLTAATKARLLR